MTRGARLGMGAVLVAATIAGVVVDSRRARSEPDQRPPRTGITFEPLGAIYARAFAFEIEHRVAPRWTLALQPAVIVATQAVTGADGVVKGETAFVGSATFGCRYFLSGGGLQGFFVGPSATVSWGGFEASPAGLTPVALAGGALVGHTFLFGDTFLLSAGLGVQYHQRVDDDRPAGGGRVLPLLRLAIGVAF